jgi:hypothetical protein
MAALPRKSDPGGAGSLPYKTTALTRRSALRESGRIIVSHDPFFSCEAACETRDSHDFEKEGVREGFAAFRD